MAVVPIGQGYRSWGAIAGFFDGDGSLNVDARKYVLHWVLSFSDNWLPQINQIREFLANQGIRVGKARRVGTGAWGFEVAEIRSMIEMAKKMLESGGIYKKKRELQLLLDYYSDKITGTDVILALNEEVRLGKRVGKIKHIEMPYTHSAGYARGRLASRYEQRALTVDESKKLIDEFKLSGATVKELGRMYDISPATVSRILRRAGIIRRLRKQPQTNDHLSRVTSAV